MYGDAAQPARPPPACGVERFNIPEILRFNEESGVDILPEEHQTESDLPSGTRQTSPPSWQLLHRPANVFP
jgi:hypothetical protein